MNEEQLQETWYGERKPGLLLSALERVYAGVSAARRRVATPAPDLVGRPIVVVGNITAGGTGKTPLVIRLCELLKERSITVAVISRGHGRDGSGPVRVGPDTPPREGGDEPVLVARRTGVPVYVDVDREAAARTAFEDGAQVVLSDDGLQRATLPRAMELCVVDASRGFGNGRLLPAGPLREPVERLGAVDWVISNGGGSPAKFTVPLRRPVASMTLRPTEFSCLDSDETVTVTEAAQRFDGPLRAIAGTGNPARFFQTLASIGLAGFEKQAFPDHHAYRREDFDDREGRTLLMTEKDAVKCERLSLDDAWSLRVEAALDPNFEEEWVATVETLLEKKVNE